MDYLHNLQNLEQKFPPISPPKGENTWENIFSGSIKNLDEYYFFQIGFYFSKIVPPGYSVLTTTFILCCNVEFTKAGISFL